jgi:hypothetical protein
MTRGRTIRTARARELFLEALRRVPNVSAAARAAGIAKRSAYDWREADSDFAAEWDDAVDESVDNLEQKAWERAEDQSDKLMEILLKGHRPEKYVERRLLGSDPANPLPSAVSLDASKLSTEALREIMAARSDATDPR